MRRLASHPTRLTDRDRALRLLVGPTVKGEARQRAMLSLLTAYSPRQLVAMALRKGIRLGNIRGFAHSPEHPSPTLAD